MPFRLPLPLPLLAALALGGTASPAHAAAEDYALDPVHTCIVLAVSHAGFSQALGSVSGSNGHLRFDPDDWRTAQVDVTVPMARIDFGDAGWNRAVQASGLLDVQRHRQARFVSTRIEPVDARHARVHGMLTLHGIDKEIVLDVSFNQLKRHPLPPFRRTAGFSATATLSRAAFGIKAWPSVIGDDVQLRIEAEAVRERAPSLPTTTPDTTP